MGFCNVGLMLEERIDEAKIASGMADQMVTNAKDLHLFWCTSAEEVEAKQEKTHQALKLLRSDASWFLANMPQGTQPIAARQRAVRAVIYLDQMINFLLDEIETLGQVDATKVSEVEGLSLTTVLLRSRLVYSDVFNKIHEQAIVVSEGCRKISEALDEFAKNYEDDDEA